MALEKEIGYGKVQFQGSNNRQETWLENVGYTKLNFQDSAATQEIDGQNVNLNDAAIDFHNVGIGIANVSTGTYSQMKITYNVSFV